MVIRCPVIKAANAPLRAAAKFTTVVAGTDANAKGPGVASSRALLLPTQVHCDGSDYLCPYYAFPATSSRKRTFSPPFCGADLRIWPSARWRARRRGRHRGRGSEFDPRSVLAPHLQPRSQADPEQVANEHEQLAEGNRADERRGSAQLREEAVMDDPI